MNLDLMKRGANAEELTRCIECVHSYKRTDVRGSYLMCSAGSGFEVEPDFYCALGERKQARLVKRGRDIITGAPYEIWDVGDGRGIYVDYYESDTKAFPVDMSRLMVDGGELRSWPYDATGGKAIRELGYEPVEEGE